MLPPGTYGVGLSPLESLVVVSDEMSKIREALGLMNSMILCGENHSEVSLQVFRDAKDAVGALSENIEHLTKLSLEHLQKKLGDWGNATFPDATEKTVLKHLKSEVNKELHEGCNADELADVGILLCQLASKRGYSLFGLMYAKHEVNLKRKWGPQNDQGFWEHEK